MQCHYINTLQYNMCINQLKWVYSQIKLAKVDGLFVIHLDPVFLKTVSPLDPHSVTARWNPVLW